MPRTRRPEALRAGRGSQEGGFASLRPRLRRGLQSLLDPRPALRAAIVNLRRRSRGAGLERAALRPPSVIAFGEPDSRASLDPRPALRAAIVNLAGNRLGTPLRAAIVNRLRTPP